MSDNQPKCIVCEQTKEERPLIRMEFKDEFYYICPEHLPVLIHQPHRLIGKLPGADKLAPRED